MRGAGPELPGRAGAARTWARPAEPRVERRLRCRHVRGQRARRRVPERQQPVPGRQEPAALSGAMRGRLLARLRRRRQLRLLLALGALALGLWAAYLELVAVAGGGAAPERSE